MNRKLVAIWVCLVILFGFAVIVVEIIPKVTAYTSHDPIRINSNTEFDAIAGIEEWIGDGSPGNPYIIEGYDINGSGYGYCIYIGNTTKHFMVRDSYFHEANGIRILPYFADSGIILYYVQNGTINNNTISSNYYNGIYVNSCRNNTIINNTVSYNPAGIELYYSTLNTITNNNASNNSNGIYLSYSDNNIIANNSVSSNSDSGIYLFHADSNTIINNNASPNNNRGIYLMYSVGNTIANNNASNNIYGIWIRYYAGNTIIYNNAFSNNLYGIFIDHSDNHTITNNNASLNNEYGIHIYYSDSNTITNNNASSNNNRGINLHFSNGNTITNNNASSNNDYGISLDFSDGNTVINNTASSNIMRGISIYQSSSNTLYNNVMVKNGIYIASSKLEDWNTHIIETNNTVNGKPIYYWKNQTGGIVPMDAGQVILANCNNIFIQNQNTSDGTMGILIGFSSNNIIINNTASSNYYYGISLFHSDSNMIINNTASNNTDGIYIYSSFSNTITNNSPSNNKYGITLRSSGSNNITNNPISNNDYGIYLYDSNNQTIVNNTMIDNGIFITGWDISHWNTHIINMTNTVDGKPVYYWKDRNGGTVSSGAGEVILANCTNVLIENQSVRNGTVGIELGFSSDNIITNNTASYNKYGIYLEKSESNIIVNNTDSINGYGIYLYYNCINNNITNNNASSNIEYGIYLYLFCNNNTITNNLVSNNKYGLILTLSSKNNKIFHNNFINNNNQSIDDTNMSNQWDDGYPKGGNYWSNYSGTDNFKGPYQNILGSDGIGDTPYIIDGNSLDNYPLIMPYTPKPLENYTILKQGWNLISIPLIQEEQNLTRVLSSVDGWYDAVQWYDLTIQNDPWKHQKVGKPFGNDLFHLNEAMGFWIHITNPGDTIFQYNGTQPTSNQSILIHPGWNMVGYPSLRRYNRTEGLSNLTFDDQVDAIWSYDATTQKWEKMGESDYFIKGRGYYIHAKSECEWEVPL